MTDIYPVKLYSPFMTNEIQILAFICDRCNYNCWYCYNKKPRSQKLLNLNSLKKFLVYIQKNTKKHISLELIGGEPTLHPDLYDFCKFTQSDDISINIYTNFSQSLEYYQRILDLNCQLSITYHDQNIDQFEKKIDKLGNYNQKNQFDIAIMYEHLKTEKSLLLFKRLKTKTYYQNNVLLSLILSDTANKIPSDYTKSEMISYEQCTKDSINSSSDFFVDFNDGSTKKLSYNELQLDYDYSCKYWKCNAGIEYFDIDINGNVYACITYGKILTNINDNVPFNIPLKPIICKSKYCQCRWNITKERIFK